jgi:DNA-binding NtrC family response regulator
MALKSYLPSMESNSLQVVGEKKSTSDFSNEREILYKVLFDMKSDLNDLKKLTLELMQNGNAKVQENNKSLIQKIYGNSEEKNTIFEQEIKRNVLPVEEEVEQEEFDDEDDFNDNYLYAEAIDEVETLSLEAKEIELIKKSLEKNKGKRKAAADELGISERTLYRKIKQFDL